ncbi:MAG: hypothetical protein WCQ99_07590 [Pseudomonadota bacterium]
MALKTTIEQLESVQALIEKIETTGQAIASGGSQLTQANLPDLYRREERLMAKYNLEQGNYTPRTYAKQGGLATQSEGQSEYPYNQTDTDRW